MLIKFIDKINNFIEKIGIRNFLLCLLVLFVYIVWNLYGTFSLFTSSEVSFDNGVKSYKFIVGDNDENIVTIGAYDSKYIDISISNSESVDLIYSLYYNSSDDIDVGVLKDSDHKASDKIKAGSDYTISLRVFNNTSTSSNVTFGVNYGSVDGGEVISSGSKIIDTIENLDYSGASNPVLDNNMIPVIYDSKNDEWIKASSDNMNPDFKWYDYSNKMWANAIVVNNDKKDSYLNSHVGSSIDMKDVVAFYVWVPRFKYRVWNVTRAGLDNYSYDAFSSGIDISFDVANSNLKCNYNVSASDGELSDVCYYDGNLITIDNNSSDYGDVWYTHPAFYYDNSKLDGFWVGKFETSGSSQFPTILPDRKSLVSENIANQFNTNGLLSNYGFSDDFNVHIMKNIEWGALAYLTYSNYGLCNNSTCSDVFRNNSLYVYTGRSSGDNNSNYNTYGSYDYRGYKLDDSGNVSATKDDTKVSSSTRNIYGVYDLAGGVSEAVMANSLNSKYSFNKSNSGLSNSLLDKYYDMYSYGRDNNNVQALYRSIMGDAVGEVSFFDGNGLNSWSSGNNDDNLLFINDSLPWLIRGGNYKESNSGLFKYSSYNGDSNELVGFRSVLS